MGAADRLDDGVDAPAEDQREEGQEREVRGDRGQRGNQERPEVHAGSDRAGSNPGAERDALDGAVRRSLVDVLVYDLRPGVRGGQGAGVGVDVGAVREPDNAGVCGQFGQVVHGLSLRRRAGQEPQQMHVASESAL